MKKTTIRYLSITFLITYLLWFSLAFIVSQGLTQVGQPIFMILFVLGGLGPTISAIITKISDKGDFRLFLSDIFKFKLHLLWYITVICVPLAISGISWLLALLLTGNAGEFLPQPVYSVLLYVPIMMIAGGLEEVGWRGVLLPELLKKISPLKATLIISLIWALWHVPLWFIKGVGQYGSNYIVFALNLTALAFLLSLLYIKTRSIFICILLHSFQNSYLTIGLNSWANNNLSLAVNVSITLIISVTIFAIFMRRVSKRKQHV